jgi:hypothetical protein
MVQSGTIKTLAALVACMTIGTGVLLLMETAPAQTPEPVALQARIVPDPSGNPASLGGNIAAGKWRNIVIHDSGQDGQRARCHFLVGGDGVVRATELWTRQADGRHVDVPGQNFNADSVGVCLLADCRVAAPTPEQTRALGDLVRQLQATLRIPAERVYTHGQLSAPGCPGKLFNLRQFRRELLDARGR